MTTVDTNVLVHAANRDSPRQRAAEALLRRLAAGPDLVTLFWPALLGFVRIATHPRVFPNPLSLSTALDAIERLLTPAHVRVLGEADDFLRRFRDAAGPVRATGNLIPDAHLVALMRQHGVREIWTGDRDFRKFDGIVIRDPFTVNADSAPPDTDG
jgi:toxin-antitoxin system PIN domain toxin